MSIADAVARIIPPIEGNSFNLDITAASQRFEIPAFMGGMQVRAMFTPDATGNAYCTVVFGDDAVVAVLNATNTVTAEAITMTDTMGEKFIEEVQRSWEIPSLIPSDAPTHFAIIGSAAGVFNVVMG